MRVLPRPFVLLAVPLAFAAGVAAQTQHVAEAGKKPAPTPPPLFETSDRCQACHNGQTTTDGEDISLGRAWRPTMMANAARDPYWHAGVRRESTDFPAAQAVIEGECSKCHMPMARLEAHAVGRDGTVFANLPIGSHPTRAGRLADDGVSCTVCHQIAPENLGTPETFSGNFVVDSATAWGSRRILGPFEIDKGRTTIMHSATRFQPGQGMHVQSSQVCATCHTLFTHSPAPAAESLPPMPEQVPYQEWEHSSYKDTNSCQSCHMPVVNEPVAISSVMGDPRDGVSRHSFLGGNFLMMRILGRNAQALGVTVAPEEFERAAARTLEHLSAESAALTVERIERSGDALVIELAVQNRAGHKLPTAYPSRRVWIHLGVRDATGRTIFESGAIRPNGSIVGNDGDDAEGQYEPHYVEIDRPDQVQLYEAVMVDTKGTPTTGLLTAVRFVKDTRLLPRGFDKATARYEVAVQGSASSDADFVGGGDLVRYRVSTVGAMGPLTVWAELRYQSIGFRWAENLRRYPSAEPQLFLRYYDAIASTSSTALAETTATARE